MIVVHRIAVHLMIPLLAVTVSAASGAKAQPVPLDRISHVHGIAVDASQPSRLYLATHQGLFAATPDGFAYRLSTLDADFMSFAAVPGDARKFYASGHPPKGGNLGVMMSDDGGTTWRRIADGADGPVDFHTLAVSPADPNVLYGDYQGIQTSRDGGATWQRIGAAPEKLFALAASPANADTLYAATMKGLLKSRDRGRTWKTAYPEPRPTTMVHVTPSGRIYAFVYGRGLVMSRQSGSEWQTVAKDFQDRYLLDLAVDPRNPRRLFAVANTSAVMISRNGGRTWYSFEGSHKATPAAIGSGERLFAENCQACHGVRGIGERPGEPEARDEFGFVAPPLNDDAHGWHHPDRQLIDMILNGSSRNKRMVAWKETLARGEVENIVVYIKSLWNFRSLACQGARHMMCMR